MGLGLSASYRSPDWGALSSDPRVPAFICAKILAGVVFAAGGSGGTGGGEEKPFVLLNGAALLNCGWLLLKGGWPKPVGLLCIKPPPFELPLKPPNGAPVG